MITVKVILDSISPEDIRLTTLQLRYPRMVHADFMTHRVFSRNGRSSRAVPVLTLLEEEPYLPHFMKNKGGMVATEEMSDAERREAEFIWLRLAKQTKKAVEALNKLKVHKQWANRPLEWFGYIDVLVTSTEWANFFALRDEVGAQPEIQELARAMKAAMDSSKPTELQPGQWHLPYIDLAVDGPAVKEYLEEDACTGRLMHTSYEVTGKDIENVLKKISVARCARLTIKPFDGDGSIEKELKRYSLLMESRPVHASPAEHIATPDSYRTVAMRNDSGRLIRTQQVWYNEHEHGNFFGWRQFRKQIPHNTVY